MSEIVIFIIMQFFILTYTGKPLGESGECCNTNYDFAKACKKCGTGARVLGNLRTKGLTKIAKDFFQTNDGDTIISAKFKEDILTSNIKIGELTKIVDYRGKELPYYHLTSEFMLPKVTDIKGLKIEDQCDVCKQNGYFNEAIIGNIKLGIPTVVKPVELFYNNVDADFLKQSDVFLSWEHMGKSNLVAHDKYVVGYARPLLIISEQVYNFLTSKRVRNIEVEKINFTSVVNIDSATLVDISRTKA
jgi:hypothetical protein